MRHEIFVLYTDDRALFTHCEYKVFFGTKGEAWTFARLLCFDISDYNQRVVSVTVDKRKIILDWMSL